ncbi:GNAT family N-acetyltransferase [Paenibacillus sp. 481]|uniref:GNAT family N-acetyltransferase n=1 Tax=Paenibacillus sp. 481 TaxID=2835869 RepID=UPI001E450544|nr:GNAT family N-acetyltransferase [Paenibacillus sp. 481]
MIQISPIIASEILELACLYEELDGSRPYIERIKEQFEHLQSNKDYLFLGAKNEQGKLVGSVMGIVCYDLTGECRPFMVVENMIVSKASQRLGVGKQLMEEIERQAKVRNCHCVILVSGATSKEAHEFYEAIGYSKGIIQGFIKALD